MGITQVLLAAWSLCLTLVVIGEMRIIGQLQTSRPNRGENGLPVGSAVVGDIQATDLDSSQMVSISPSGRPLVLILLQGSCSACRDFAGWFTHAWESWLTVADVALVCSGPAETVREFRRSFPESLDFFWDADRRVASALKCHAAPFGFVLSEDGRVAAKAVVSRETSADTLLAALRTTR